MTKWSKNENFISLVYCYKYLIWRAALRQAITTTIKIKVSSKNWQSEHTINQYFHLPDHIPFYIVTQSACSGDDGNGFSYYHIMNLQYKEHNACIAQCIISIYFLVRPDLHHKHASKIVIHFPFPLLKILLTVT